MHRRRRWEGGGGRSKGNAGTTNRRKRTFRHCTHRLFCRNAQTGCQSQNSCTAPVNGTSQLNQSAARHVHGVSGKGKRKREKGRGSQTIIFYKATCLCRRREGGKESPRRHASVTPMRKSSATTCRSPLIEALCIHYCPPKMMKYNFHQGKDLIDYTPPLFFINSRHVNNGACVFLSP